MCHSDLLLIGECPKGRTGYKSGMLGSNQMAASNSSGKISESMLEDKVSNALDWLRSARDRVRSYATGTERLPAERPRVGLALAGGFARGIAHIGVLRALAKAEIPIDCVAGTSVGALIGACYCAGVPLEEMQRIASSTTFADFGRWTPSWLGLATNQRMEAYLARFTHIKKFEDLRTPLAIAATDINAGISVYYTKGMIAPALRGSCAYPGLFVPIQFEGRTLVDGFLTAPVPVEGALLLGADIVIAVYLEALNTENPRTVADVVSRSFNIIQRHGDIAWRPQADVIIEPDVKSFVWDDFTRTNDMVTAGEAAAEAAIPAIKALLSGEKRDSEVGSDLAKVKPEL
jgi:NTE family protein